MRVRAALSQLYHAKILKFRCLQDQYIFLHDAILEIVACGDTSMDSERFKLGCISLQQIKPITNKTALETQYIVLGQVTPDPGNISSKTASAHPGKNRNAAYLPSQLCICNILLYLS